MTDNAGIINPFRDPEPPKPTRNELGKGSDPEKPPEVRRVKLDGDSFGLSFNRIDEDEDSEDLGERLARLLYDVNVQFRSELRECGIKVLKPNIAYAPEPGEMVLRSKTAVLVISTGIVQNESAVFRQIGYALHTLPVKAILEKHNAKLHVRG